jgi:hypothetical protein
MQSEQQSTTLKMEPTGTQGNAKQVRKLFPGYMEFKMSISFPNILRVELFFQPVPDLFIILS